MHCSHGLYYRALRNAQRGVMMMGSAVHVHVHATEVTVSGLVHAAEFQGQEALCSIGFRQPGGQSCINMRIFRFRYDLYDLYQVHAWLF